MEYKHSIASAVCTLGQNEVLDTGNNLERPNMALATEWEACEEYAHNAGQDHPLVCWILTPWDVWVKNPFYSGPTIPHPESDFEDDGPGVPCSGDEIPY